MLNLLENKGYFSVVGANHRSSTMLFRDKLVIKNSQIANVYDRLLKTGIRQTFVVSNTDRTEFYIFHDPANDPATEIIKLLSAHAGVGRGEIESQTYIFKDSEAYKHLLAVCCALDSLVIGDTKTRDSIDVSYNNAKHAGMTGLELDFLVSNALTVSNRVFKETKINRHPVSIPAALTQVARDLHGDLGDCTGLLIGSGEMGEMLATSLISTGIAHFVVAHPILSRAEAVGKMLNCHVGGMEDLPILLENSDLVLTSLNSRQFTLTSDTIKTAIRKRRRKPVLIIDTGVPGDVDYSAANLEDAFLYTLDDLEKVTREGMQTRELETEKAWDIVQVEVDNIFSYKKNTTGTIGSNLGDNLIENLRQNALAKADGDADKATQLFVQSLMAHLENKSDLTTPEPADSSE